MSLGLCQKYEFYKNTDTHTYIGGNPVPSLRGCPFLDDCKLLDVLFHRQRQALRRMHASIDTPWRGHDHRAIAYDNDQIYKTAWDLSKILTPTLRMHVTERPFGYSLDGGKPDCVCKCDSRC